MLVLRCLTGNEKNVLLAMRTLMSAWLEILSLDPGLSFQAVITVVASLYLYIFCDLFEECYHNSVQVESLSLTTSVAQRLALWAVQDEVTGYIPCTTSLENKLSQIVLGYCSFCHWSVQSTESSVVWHRVIAGRTTTVRPAHYYYYFVYLFQNLAFLMV